MGFVAFYFTHHDIYIPVAFVLVLIDEVIFGGADQVVGDHHAGLEFCLFHEGFGFVFIHTRENDLVELGGLFHIKFQISRITVEFGEIYIDFAELLGLV